MEDVDVLIDQMYPERINLDLFSHLLHAGCTPMIQKPIRLGGKTWMHFAIGVGGQYAYSKEVCKKNDVVYGDGQKTDVVMTKHNLNWLENGRCFTWNFSASSGFERKISKRNSISLHYGFSYWTPVNRMTERDLFPLYPKRYKERFYSHTISLLLFAKSLLPCLEK